MKKVLGFIALAFTLLTSVVTSAFAYFYFDNSDVSDSFPVHGINAKFDKDVSDSYKVYFFASPYYAVDTTIDGVAYRDPLAIADNDNNPYNDDSDFLIRSRYNLDKKTEKNANVTYPNGRKYYLSAESIDESKIGTSGAIKMYQKKKWSGYLLKNSDAGINEETSKYVVQNVKGNLSSDYLNKIIAQTVYKNSNGYGPEFVGWTYDKKTSAERAMHKDSSGNYQIYKKNSSFLLADSSGSTSEEEAPQIGNFGAQNTIDLISPSTSLYYIDNLDGDNSGLSIDGSKKGDRTIYLYPVFSSKLSGADLTKDNKYLFANTDAYIPLLKIRANAEKDDDGSYTYNYKQSGEVDYKLQRYTTYLLPKTVSSHLDFNYFTDDVFIPKFPSSDLTDFSLDINVTNSTSGWTDHWASILSYEDFVALSLEEGTYDLDVSLWELSGTIDEDNATNEVENVVAAFEKTNRYIAVIGSRRSDSSGRYGITYISSGKTKKAVCYAIGLRKNEEFRITSDASNGSIDDYASANGKRFFSAYIGGEDDKYLYSNAYRFENGVVFSILTKGKTTTTIPYSFSALNQESLLVFNEYLSSSNHKNKEAFKTIGNGSPIDVSEDGKHLICNATGLYKLALLIEYENGVPSSIQVAYREENQKCSLFILSSKPTSSCFFDGEELLNSDGFLAVFTDNAGSFINYSTIFETRDNGTISFSEIKENHQGKTLIDTATGQRIPYSTFEKGDFSLNRDYVLYFE